MRKILFTGWFLFWSISSPSNGIVPVGSLKECEELAKAWSAWIGNNVVRAACVEIPAAPKP